MWMMPLHLQVNQKSDYDDMRYFNTDSFKETKLMDMILDKRIYQNRFLCFQLNMLLVHIEIAS